MHHTSECIQVFQTSHELSKCQYNNPQMHVWCAVYVRCTIPLDNECEVVGAVQAQSHLSLWYTSKTAPACMLRRRVIGQYRVMYE